MAEPRSAEDPGVMRRFRRRFKRLEAIVGPLFSDRINRSPVLVLGNQKSGTSAIAALLGHATGLSVTLDLPGISEPVHTRLHRGEISFARFVECNWRDFSRDIVKEPGLTLLVDDMDHYFDRPRYVFVVRDPRGNIRSILNRLGIRGDLNRFDEAEAARRVHNWKSWRTVVYGEGIGIARSHYIEALADRWTLLTNVCVTHRQRFHLVRYEDFLKDKEGAIRGLARRLNVHACLELGNKVDRHFQPPGDNSLSLLEFFGAANLRRINSICAKNMSCLGYSGEMESVVHPVAPTLASPDAG